MKKIRWGLIGCGKVVLKNKKTPFININNTITAICTTSVKTATNAKKKLKLKHCKCYDNIDIMLKDNNFDCIYIATPPKFHYYYLKKVQKYNIPIYVEKPFVTSLKEAEKIKKMYKSDNYIFVAHYKRLTRQIKIIKKLINNGNIGEITSVTGIFGRKFDINAYNNSWLYNKSISGGGKFIDIAPHILDTLYYLFGKMEITNSKVEYNSLYNTEEFVKTNIKFSNFNCVLLFDFNSKIDIDKIIINGTKGTIATSINRDFNIYVTYQNKKKKTYHIKKPKIWGIETVKEIDKYLITGIKNKNLCTLDDAYFIQQYMHLIMKK